MKALSKPLLALTALASAFYLSISYEFTDPGWAVQFTVQEAQAQPASTTKRAYDLRGLPILNRAVIHIKENYVDPSRINERKMIGAAMEEVQRAVAELLVEVKKDSEGVPSSITVRVDRASKDFGLEDVGNLWQMSFKFKDIFTFIQDNLRHHDDLRDVEYAAINGMLSTLDPHSVLLRPDDYREMKLSTRGKFGGLGIVISIRDGQLTIVNPIEDTPASRKGLKAGDRIVQIGLDSTVNMALSDAVDMLRGEANTSIDIWVMREGWKKAKKFNLTRASIKVKSVTSRLLKDRVGIARVRNFQNTTFDELKKATKAMGRKAGRKGLKGLIIDLRGNPGGLLDQAIKISDFFIDSGPLVTTVGYGDKMREPKMASKAATLARFPVIVLVNAGSASASEIVAGALKNHHRALLIGQQTFGKGSVQVIYDNKDDSALKLTIAQYLTPGDMSIQSVGVTPDILTQAVALEGDEIDFFRSLEGRSGEKDLPEHLEHRSTQVAKGVKPAHRLRYLSDKAERKRVEDNPNDIIEDFEIRLARRLLGEIKATNRDQMLDEAAAALADVSAAEDARIVEALGKIKVDWNPLEAVAGTPKAEVTLTADKPSNQVVSGETLKLKATVKNVGDGPYVKLRAMTESDNPFFDDREFLFGNVPAGESRTFEVPIKLDRSALTRRDLVKLKFKAASGAAPETASIKLEVRQLLRPRFALTWRLDDSKRGNGDGLMQVGEAVDLIVKARNIGKGKSYDVLGELRNPSKAQSRAIFVQRGRMKAEGLEPGEERELKFSFRIKDSLTDGEVEIRVHDSELREYTMETVPIRVVAKRDKIEDFRARLVPRVGQSINLRGTYHMKAAPVMTANGSAITTGRLGDWFRVPTGDGRHGWVAAGEVTLQTDAKGETITQPAVAQAPAQINLSDQGPAVETADDTLALSGEVLSGKVIKDMLIYVNNKKVYFKSNAEPEISRDRLKFSARVPLEAGANRITLIAREDDDRASRRTVFVSRPR